MAEEKICKNCKYSKIDTFHKELTCEEIGKGIILRDSFDGMPDKYAFTSVYVNPNFSCIFLKNK